MNVYFEDEPVTTKVYTDYRDLSADVYPRSMPATTAPRSTPTASRRRAMCHRASRRGARYAAMRTRQRGNRGSTDEVTSAGTY